MSPSLLASHFHELYRYRVLIESLVRREIKARYRGSILGYFWTLLNPLLLLMVYWLIFTQFTRAVELRHYPVFLFVGILPWLWLSSSLAAGTMSMVQGGALITRACVPPQVLPAVTVLSNLVNFALAVPIALIAAALSGIRPSVALAVLPVAIAVALAFIYGVTLLFATLAVPFRDVYFLIQSLLSIWFFLTPIAYPLGLVPERYRPLVLANPATSIILPFQQILFERQAPSLFSLALAAGWSALALFTAILVFERARGTLVEQI